ncbi:MAG: TRAP transporter small permease [Gemmobacter sp.]
MAQALRTVRRGLDALYLIGGIISALFLVAILLLILAQMGSRWLGIQFAGGADYAGYCMAGASFMAFAYALNHGAHIRVSLLLQFMGRARRWGELWCFAIGTAASIFLLRYAWKGAWTSWRFGDVSQGQDATPLWIPQSVVVVGAALLAIAFVDNLIRVLFTGTSGVRADVSETQAD